MSSFGSSAAHWNLLSSAVGNQISNGMWGWGNAPRSKNCSSLSVGKISVDRLGENKLTVNIFALYSYTLSHEPAERSSAEEDLGHNLAWPRATVATSDLGTAPSLELLVPLHSSGTPCWRLPVEAGGGHRNCLSQKCCWGLPSELRSEFPYPPPEQILCWVSVNSVKLLKRGTESSFICKCMTAGYLFGLLGIFGKWWYKLEINAVDWGADSALPSEGFAFIVWHLWGLSFLRWLCIICQGGSLCGTILHGRTFMWICLGHLHLLGPLL